MELIRDAAVALVELRQRSAELSLRDGKVAEEEFVSADQNARLADQFDAVLHLDQTEALAPPDRSPGWQIADAPDTDPFAV